MKQRARLIEISWTYQTMPDPDDKSYRQFTIRAFSRDGETKMSIDIPGENGVIEDVPTELLDVMGKAVVDVGARAKQENLEEQVE